MGKNFLGQLQQLLARLTPRQRLITGGGLLLTLVALAAMARTFGEPDYKPLMTGLEPADAQAIAVELASKKIDYQLAADGKGISVAANQLDAARMEIASEGPVHSGRMGFELFDKTSWGQTEFDEKVNYQRALEGELERTIGTLNGVKSARVHLVLPTASVFLDRERGAKASVALRMKHGSLGDEQLRAIARLVSGAVDDLKPEDVTILDADTNETMGSHGGSMEGHELEAELTRRLLATLGPAVGPENLRASVNVEFDKSSSEESQDKYDPAVSAVLSSQKSREQTGTGAAAAGVAGTSANLPASTPANATAQDATGSDDGAQMTSSENTTFGVNKIVRHTVTPAGRIQRLTAAILVNDLQDHKLVKGKWLTSPRKPTTAQLQQLQQLAQSVLGADLQRGDVVTVQNMSFSTDASADTPPGLADTLRRGVSDYATLVRYVAMLLAFVLVWALMFRPVQKQIVASMKELNPQDLQAALPSASATPHPELAARTAATLVAAEGESGTVASKRKLTELIQAEPAAMTRTLQSWLREDTV